MLGGSVTEKRRLAEGEPVGKHYSCADLKPANPGEDAKRSEAQPALVGLMVWEAMYVICCEKILLRVTVSVPEQRGQTGTSWSP